LPYERVHIWNVTKAAGSRPTRSRGRPVSGLICVNGAAAHHARPGDVVILATFAEASDEDEARAWKPIVVRVDAP